LGTQGIGDYERFGVLVDGLERLGFDSLWLSDRLTGGAPEPVVALAFAAGRTQRLKLGTSVLVLPGRNPVVLAKELASLDRLSDGRCCCGRVRRVRRAQASRRSGSAATTERPGWTKVLPLLRRLWTEDRVTHHGPRFQFEELTVLPRPIQQPIDIWLGGLARAALRRLGRIADGWLPSTITPAEAARGRALIEESARRCDRIVDPEHFGAMVVYASRCHPAALQERLPPSPGHRSFASRPRWSSRDPRHGWGLRRGRHLEVRTPASRRADDWAAELEELAPWFGLST